MDDTPEKPPPCLLRLLVLQLKKSAVIIIREAVSENVSIPMTGEASN